MAKYVYVSVYLLKTVFRVEQIGGEKIQQTGNSIDAIGNVKRVDSYQMFVYNTRNDAHSFYQNYQIITAFLVLIIFPVLIFFILYIGYLQIDMFLSITKILN